MLGKKTGYEISTCQMQYDANDMDGTVLENVESIMYLGVAITNDLRWNIIHMSAIFVLRLIGPLASSRDDPLMG